MRPPADSPPGRLLVVALLTGLTVLVWIQAARTYPVFNATIDEGRHVASSIEIYQTGAFTLFYTSPLPRYLIGLLPFADGVRLPESDHPALDPYLDDVRGHRESAIGRYVLEDAGQYWRTLTLARLGTLAFVPLLLWITFRWTERIFDRRAGMAAAALVALEPNLLAHGALATTDFATATLLTVAAYSLWRWAERRDRASAIAAAVASAAACASKMPVIALLALLAVSFAMLPTASGRPAVLSWPRRRELTAQLGIFAGVVFLTLWAIYRFSVSTLTARTGRQLETIDRLFAPGGALNGLLHRLSDTVPVPMPAFFDGLATIWHHSQLGWRSYLLGEISTDGFWYYYPVAFVLKATLPFLLLVGLALASLFLRRGQETRRRLLFPLVAVAVVLLVACLSKANIGVRHVLVLFPLLAIPAGGLFAVRARPRRTLRIAALALLAWHAVESWSAHPDYLAYFNPIARDRAPEMLLDSNLDWGQDLARLGRVAAAEDIESITLSVFGARYGTGPEAVGLSAARYLGPGERPSGWFAVSYNHLAGIGLPPAEFAALDGFGWLGAHRPRALVGRSILLYHLP